MTDPASLAMVGFFLILVGFVAAFAALILMLLSSDGEKKVKGGGAIIIGPIPIVFGTDKKTVKMLLGLSIILMVLVLLASIFLNYL